MFEKSKELTLEERKSVQLEMLKEIDVFCNANNIRYSLAFGTLLGAIRHKGFIPWDDDVDIMMPLPDMLLFKEKFTSETLKYCDVDTEPHFSSAFSRIAHKGTYNKSGMFGKSYGICIDLYPLISLPSNDKERMKFFATAEKYKRIRTFFIKLRRNCVKFLPVKTVFGHDAAIKKYRNFMFNVPPYGSTGVYYAIAAPLKLRNKTTYDIDLFKECVRVEFEGCKFWATSQYHLFLNKMYGDYMQLPPEKDRHPYHGGHYYWR